MAPAHSGCELNKESHFLEDLPEWRLFQSLRPLITSKALRWSLAENQTNTAIEDRRPKHRRPETIYASNNLKFFKAYLRGLPGSLPDRDLACLVFDDCRNNLVEVLRFFDGVVLESACNAARLLPHVESPELSDNDDFDREKQEESTPEKSRLEFVWSYLGGFKFFLRDSEPIPAPRHRASPEKEEAIQHQNKPGALETFPNLLAMAKIFKKCSQAEVDMEKACAPYFKLKNEVATYRRGS